MIYRNKPYSIIYQYITIYIQYSPSLYEHDVSKILLIVICYFSFTISKETLSSFQLLLLLQLYVFAMMRRFKK
jgi:hypothetical protein